MQNNEVGDSSKDNGQGYQAVHVEDSADRFSHMLIEARIKSGYSLEQVALLSRISIQSLSALERGDFLRLPGAVFGRGFIRTLCTLYHTNSQEMLGAFAVALDEGEIKEPPLMGTEEMRQRCLTGSDRLTSRLMVKFRATLIGRYLSSGYLVTLLCIGTLAVGGIYLGTTLVEKFYISQGDDAGIFSFFKNTTENQTGTGN